MRGAKVLAAEALALLAAISESTASSARRIKERKQHTLESYESIHLASLFDDVAMPYRPMEDRVNLRAAALAPDAPGSWRAEGGEKIRSRGSQRVPERDGDAG